MTKKIKLLLKEKGISQTELAENVGVSQAIIATLFTLFFNWLYENFSA